MWKFMTDGRTTDTKWWQKLTKPLARLAKKKLNNKLLIPIYSETCLHWTLSKPNTCLNQTDFTVPSLKSLCNLNLCKPNTCLNWTNSSVPKGFGLLLFGSPDLDIDSNTIVFTTVHKYIFYRFYCIWKHLIGSLLLHFYFMDLGSKNKT
jgi:hypothetical protein